MHDVTFGRGTAGAVLRERGVKTVDLTPLWSSLAQHRQAHIHIHTTHMP
jgi:hypothetical protein